MKKLLFAIAGAAAFSAFAADPAAGANDISIVGFENYTADQTVIGYGDDGNSGGSLWSCVGDDASLVKTYAGGDIATPTIKEPAPFDGAAENTKYLALDTNGSELQRAIPAGGQEIAAGGTYVDTLVQFTPSESAPGETDLTGAKLAIWLGVVNNVTNLYVQGGFLEGPEDAGTPTIDTAATQAYKLGNIEVEPGKWYRLTVKAVVLDDDGAGNTISGFQIYVDGTLAVSDTAVADAAGIQYYTDYADEEGVLPGAAGLLSAKTLIPSCAGVIADTTLTSVGFKGTGALDDFVVTTADPSFAPAAISLTLTWEPAEVTAVLYVLESDPATTNEVTSGTAVNIPVANVGTNVTLIATFASGYEFDYLDIGGYQLQSLTFPVPNVSTNATLVAKATPAGWVDDPTDVAGQTAAVAYPALAGTALATANAGELTTWAKANSVSFTDATTDPDDYVEAFLLNCAVADVDTEKEEFKATITVGADGTITVTTPDGKDYNGTLKLKGKANLSDAEWADVPNNTPTSSYHFYMYELSL